MIKELFKDYRNGHGVVTLNDTNTIISQGLKYETQNPYLWSGQYYLALKYFGEFDYSIKNFIEWHLDNQVEPGLFRRYPTPYEFTEHFDSISFDEQNGLAFACIALDNYYELNKVIRYGENNSWIFDDRPISLEERHRKFTLTEWLNLLKTLYKIIKFAIKTGDYGGSGAMDKIIFADPIASRYSRKRQPKDSALLKMISVAYKPSFLEVCHFYLASWKTIKKPKRSGVNMLLYKLIAFSVIGYNPKWLRKIKTEFLKMDIVGYAHMFYPKDHPFIEVARLAVKKLKNEVK